MSTIKVDEIFGDQPTDAVDLPNKLKVGGASVEEGYSASGSEPSSPSNGDYWWDTGNDKLYKYMDSGFKELGLAAAAAWYGDRGITAGGKFAGTSTGKITRIDYKDITSSGNATTFGNLSDNRTGVGSVSDASRMVLSLIHI